MDFIDEVRTRSSRFAGRLEHLETEEATKTGLVMPFIQMLGYDIFNPTEVMPEFTADIGTKRGEKVDYAIMQDGKPTILIECKKYGADLSNEAVSQLFRYFGVTDAHFGLLTDGITYRFFSDLDQPNVMDAKPFFEFNMLNFTDKAVEELKRFTKEGFDPDETQKAASTLKYIEGMKQVLVLQLSTPDEEFIRWLTKQVYSKSLTQAARERFSHMVRKAFGDFIDDRINATLQSALARDTAVEPAPEAVPLEDDAPTAPPGVTTTEEEVQGYELVKAIVGEVVEPERVVMRDTKN
ncbi:MAG: type I restriction enzyme HsdR N-terminal domain-containing protein [Dehalococcoidia bacterium]|nr:type I restriction enzyme HsdR N-terminal domain-containing protein [Dehalococcoidia bacterium]